MRTTLRRIARSDKQAFTQMTVPQNATMEPFVEMHLCHRVVHVHGFAGLADTPGA
jgi:hypothetical protein